MKKATRLLILFALLMSVITSFSVFSANAQEINTAKPGDLIIRFEGKTIGPVGGIPHIGIYTGTKTKDSSSYDVIDLGIENGQGFIRPSHSTDETRFKDPGFYSVLDSQIPIRYRGEATTLSALPEGVKNGIREKLVAMAEKDLGSTFGKYEFWQFSKKGHSVNCGDWILDLYNKALKSEGIQVMSHKFPGSHGLGNIGLKPGELKDYAEILWGTTDPSRLPGWLPRVGSPQSSAQNLGGVDISPQPKKVGEGGKELKEKVLKSRPSGDSLSWPVENSK